MTHDNFSPMPLAKVWANSTRAPNPKWPPSAIMEIIYSTVLPTLLQAA